MYESIMVPLDGSPLAEQVLPYVSRISLGLGIPVHLMQVLHTVPEELADPAHGLYRSNITTGVQDEAMDYLNSVKRRTPGSEVILRDLRGRGIWRGDRLRKTRRL